jgi:ubiquinone/menaquinone biosynthesis C-methylase UbiE
MAPKFDPANAHRLEDPERLKFQSPDVVVGLLGLRGDETVVDYGAGTGVYTIPLSAAVPNGRVVAVDSSAELLFKLEEKVEALPDEAMRARIMVVHTTDNHVPLFDRTVQAVLGVNLLHEVHDEPAALGEIARFLDHGGRFVVVDWARVDRPVGPAADHVLTVSDALATLTGMGLLVDAIHQPGELFPYHFALVASKQ